jgi:hypothetical protein
MSIVLRNVGCMLSVGFEYTCHIFNCQCDYYGRTQGLIIHLIPKHVAPYISLWSGG